MRPFRLFLALVLAGIVTIPGHIGKLSASQQNPSLDTGAGSWLLLPNGPRAGNAQRHDDLSFIDENTVWVVNGDGQVWHTADGGNSWTLLALTGGYNRCVGFANAQHGWIGMLYQLGTDCLFRTDNGGTTWTPVTLPDPTPVGLCGMQVFDDSTMVAVGAYYGTPRFIRTDDDGQSWTVKDLSAKAGALVDVHFFDKNTGIAIGSYGPNPTRRTRILRTTDGGLTWSVRWTGTRDQELCWKISFVDDNIGFVSIENLAGTGAAYFLKTLDGGLTWEEIPFSGTYQNCQGIGFVTEYFGWLGGWNIGTYITQDGGDQWTWKNFGYNVNRIRFINRYLGYACGRDVYKFTASPSGVGDPSHDQLAAISRVAPNPFERSTIISYRVTQPGPVSLRVFDVQGRPVRNLVERELDPGDYTASFDGSNLPAGAYFYELRTPTRSENGKLKLLR